MTAPTIVPFWNRLPEISLYPFRGAAIYTTAILALGITLLGWMPIFGAILWVAAFKFAFDTLERTANGYMHASEVSSGRDNSLVWRYVVLQVLTILVPAMLSALTTPAVGMVTFLAFVVVQPAAIMGLVLSGSLARGLNPGLWVEVISRIGWPYLALVGLMMVMQLSAANASELLASIMPWFIARALVSTFALWSMFATFHLMGYLIYQYHEILSFEPSALAAAQHRPFDRDAELTERVSEMVQNGQIDAATELLRAEIRSRAVSIEAQSLYRRLLQQQNNTNELVAHGRTYLHLLLEEKQEKLALNLARECLELDAAFSAPLIEQNATLAKRASFGGQSALAVSLLLAAIRHPQSHPDKPLWALQAADLMTRQSGREEEARRLLADARMRCQDDDLLGKIDAQLAGIPA